MQNKKSRGLPFLLSAPLSSKDGIDMYYKKIFTVIKAHVHTHFVGTCILTALPPYADDSCKRWTPHDHVYCLMVLCCSEFGRAFQQAAARIRADASFDYFNAAG